jgi:multicomponent Na+:H+ antiporter subunit F
MTVAVVIAGGLLLIGAAAAVIRVVLGPSVADRMVAVDTLLFIGVGALGLYIVQTGDTTYVPVLIVAVLIAFLGTVVVARYIEAETER